MFSVAAMLGGARFVGTKRLRIKESDRIAAMQEELAKLGVMLTADEDSVTVNPGVLRMPDVPLDGHGDHRIVMALSVLLTVTGGVIEGAEHVNKSFPDFFEKLQELGIEVQLCNGSATPEY
jgi:3-phosphoshikimate 1-carboxyvinyltransferase